MGFMRSCPRMTAPEMDRRIGAGDPGERHEEKQYVHGAGWYRIRDGTHTKPGRLATTLPIPTPILPM